MGGIINQYPGAVVVKPKLRYDLIPPHSIEMVAECLTVGSVKHGDTNYIDNPRPGEVARQVGSMLRHLYAFLRGEERDADGFHHLAAVATRALMILELKRMKSLVVTDSLYKPTARRSSDGFVSSAVASLVSDSRQTSR